MVCYPRSEKVKTIYVANRFSGEENSGKHWGRSATYPPYNDVNERDTLLVELEQGSCLMYFWHSRWRRAQDVWRWDEQQNAVLGCPYVFD